MKTDYLDVLRDCFREIRSIEGYVSSNPFDSKNKFLQSYLVMRCSGTTEYIFKSMLYDKIAFNLDARLKTYFENTILKNPSNPSYKKMIDLLSKYDRSWGKAFSNCFSSRSVDITNIKSLIETRNGIAHGSPGTIPSINETKEKFYSCCRALHCVSKILI